MAIAIPDKAELYSDNIIIGYAELVATYTEDGLLRWELPGGEFTTSRAYAEGYAERLDRMIRANMERLGRRFPGAGN